MFSRHEPYRPCLGYIEKSCFWKRWPTNHSERSMPICHWGVGQSGPKGPSWISGQYVTSNTDMHQCKRTCYWVLEVLVYAATWHTHSKSLAVLLYNLQFLVFISNTESCSVVFVYIYSICMQRFRNSQNRGDAKLFWCVYILLRINYNRHRSF